MFVTYEVFLCINRQRAARVAYAAPVHAPAEPAEPAPVVPAAATNAAGAAPNAEIGEMKAVLQAPVGQLARFSSGRRYVSAKMRVTRCSPENWPMPSNGAHEDE